MTVADLFDWTFPSKVTCDFKDPKMYGYDAKCGVYFLLILRTQLLRYKGGLHSHILEIDTVKVSMELYMNTHIITMHVQSQTVAVVMSVTITETLPLFLL